MPDMSTIGIMVGILCAALYACARARRQRSFDATNVALVFLAGVAAVGTINLLRAALLGSEASLPASWREHLALAALIGFGLALDFIAKAFEPYRKRRRG